MSKAQTVTQMSPDGSLWHCYFYTTINYLDYGKYYHLPGMNLSNRNFTGMTPIMNDYCSFYLRNLHAFCRRFVEWMGTKKRYLFTPLESGA